MEGPRHRIAVDIGGTFTDCTVSDASGSVTVAKASTTPDDLVRGVLDALGLAAEELALSTRELLGATSQFVHGSTVATNAVTVRGGVTTGLLTTRGYGDTLAIGRVLQKTAGLSQQEIVHSSRVAKPDPPILERSWIREVTERIDRDGNVLVPLDVDEVRRGGIELVERGAAALAVCFLWSFVNPEHERLAREALEDACPGVYLSFSSEVVPALGEYERTVTTVLNAYVGPLLDAYLGRLERTLAEHGFGGSMVVTHAAGGVTDVPGALARPVATIDSGPSGGTVGARDLGAALEVDNLICADVGGTTFDVSLVAGGEIELDRRPVISQYTLLMPKVAIRSIGAGGGSIAWVDEDGLLRVGPASAGADPGPAAYGRGGTAATVTDANIVLGLLDPGAFQGGRMALDPDAARQAVERLAATLGRDAIEVAAGIFAIANAHMADLIRRCVIERGHDPRAFTLVAYGGAGPTHAAHYARDAGVARVVIPAAASVFSSFGMLTADLTHSAEVSRTYRLPLSEAELADLRETVADLAERARQGREGRLRAQVTAKFAMQAQVLSVDLPDLEGPDVSDLVEREFRERYVALYGADTIVPGAAIEIEGVQVESSEEVRDGGLGAQPAPEASDGMGLAGATRPVYWGSSEPVDTPVVDYARARPGHVFPGPCIVERASDSAAIPAGLRGEVDARGNLVIVAAGSP